VELNWSTFVLEVINFLILVWLLKHFLYQPVLNVIAQRRQKIEAELSQAAKGQEEAKALKQQYEQRLAEWEEEKRGALDGLEQQIEQERSKRSQQLDDELQQQRLKHQARDEQQQNQWRSQAESEALQLGAAFATRLLQKLSGTELDLRLQQLFIEQLAALPESAVKELHEGWQGKDARIEITSATALDKTRQQEIRQSLEQKLGQSEAEWSFEQDEKLIAGLRISIGGWMLQANLQDELRFFTEAAAPHG
jgi:F-type H+-transporting ATPase subunit b